MVSVIIPIFNTAPYLGQCLDSLLAQTVPEWEALLVDDASTDGSAAIAKHYAEEDSRFHLFIQSQNSGQSAARNRGLEEAKGEYVVFLDSDDWLESDFLEKHLAAISGYDIVQSGYRRMRDGEIIKCKVPIHRWQFTSTCMRMYRRDIISEKQFFENTYYEDVLWTVDLLLKKPRINFINYTGYNYRLRPGSTTSSSHKNDREKVLSELKKKGMHPVVLYTRIKLRLFLFRYSI